MWLAKEQFPNGYENIPQKVLELQKNGLTIKWCHDIKSYKKLIPSLKIFPNDIIVTADDDAFYPQDWLQQLVDAYKEKPQCIHCHRAHRVLFDDNTYLLPYRQWQFEHQTKTPSFRNFFTGVGGVLYPPQSLDAEVENEELFTELAPFADDVWFWAMALKKGTKINILPNWQGVININPERASGQNDEFILSKYNIGGGNDLQIAKVLNKYKLSSILTFDSRE